MSVASIVQYDRTDILIGKNDVGLKGFDKNSTFGQMLDLAIANRCPIIIKNGGGKWYLKGQDKTPETLEPLIEEKLGTTREGVKLWLVKFN